MFSQMRADTSNLRDTASARIDATLAGFSSQARVMAAGVGIAAILLCVGVLLVGRWLIRTVTGPLKRLNETAFAQLNGQSVEFVAEHNDEVGALAQVLERQRLMVEDRYAGAREEARRADTLNKLGDLIAFSTAEYEVIDGTVRALRRLVQTRRGDVQLTNASRNRLLYAGSWGVNPPGLDTPVPVDRIDRCPAIRRAAPFVVPDVEDDLAVLCPAHQQEEGSLACVPLIAMGQPIGVIHLESDTPITDETVAVAMRLAEQVAVAIANARLMTTMESLAMTDGLTGLRNARFFDSYLDQELAAAERDHEPLCVLMLDIDHFKAFNDNFGHPAGDEALRVFGRVVRATLRSSDMPARNGGEDIVIALRHTDLDGAILVAEKLREAVSQAIVEIGPGRFGRLTVSVGVAEADLTRIDQRVLISTADAALYRAKASGRNRVVVASRDVGDEPIGADPAAASPTPVPLASHRRRRPTGQRSTRSRAAQTG
jgi:diguanylate cyclase (GGDEF)-like protein